MKSCLTGFIRCRRRDGPCGSHHVEARALKWEISAGETVEEGRVGGDDDDDDDKRRGCWKWDLMERGAARRRRVMLRREVGVRIGVEGVIVEAWMLLVDTSAACGET